VDISIIDAGGYKLRVATTQGSPGSLPLLLFNGIGANLELLRGFAEEMQTYGIGVITFDVPGTGDSVGAAPSLRSSCIAMGGEPAG